MHFSAIRRLVQASPTFFGSLPLLRRYVCAAATAAALIAPATRAAELADLQKLYLRGDYAECAQQAERAMRDEPRVDDWPILLTRALTAVGRYADASTAISNALERQPFSVSLRMEAYEVFRQNGQGPRARAMLSEINQIANVRRWALNEPKSLVALGRAALILGADARVVLENFLNQAKTTDPNYRESYLAIGNLSLDKYDYEMAADTFREALKQFPDDPDMYHGLARAFASSDPQQMGQAVETALEKNRRHTPSLLLEADHLINAEQYGEAAKILDEVLSINPSHPEAWAYRAVIAHLRHQPEEEAQARERALRVWRTNPNVDHLIGLKLSQKYRFTEGAAYQRRALQSDSEYLRARLQLAQDLLRLGDDTEGWSLAEQVHEKDAYDVVAYNLTTLHDTIASYTLVTNADFAIHMVEHESNVYGERALQLLQRARDTLTEKYEFDPPSPTTIEIFPEQKEFAIRTFAMPGGEGFLAVCFGNVITVNSPKSQPGVNWEAVLWHEFCHTITLGLTKNRMPRWLSEGISVFEEQQANPAWGQAMTPEYRSRILEDKLTPVGNLSAAFMTAKDGEDMQFAYYQSALVVEYLVQKFGHDALKKILRDLGEGVEINEAIAKSTAPLPEIEKEFVQFARDKAETLGGELDWTRPEVAGPTAQEFGIQLHPKNYYRLTREARQLIGERKWEEAKPPIQTLLDNFPEGIGGDSAYAMMAAVHRGLGETEKEWEILNRFAGVDATAVDAYARLMQLAAQKEDWEAVETNANRFLAVNPLVPLPYQFLASASERTGKPQEAIGSYRILLTLDPPDPVDVHFRLAKLLKPEGASEAKRHVLQALEDAPRYREALRMLTELNRPLVTNPPPANTPEAPVVP